MISSRLCASVELEKPFTRESLGPPGHQGQAALPSGQVQEEPPRDSDAGKIGFGAVCSSMNHIVGLITNFK